jgi:cytochrome c oxidase subunit 2
MRLRKIISGPAFRACFPLILLLVLAGCSSRDYPQSTLDPKTDFTRMIDHIFMTTVWWAVVVFVLVEGALVFAIFKFRGKPTDPEPVQTHGNTAVEVIWTIIPAVILALIAVPTIRGIFETSEIPTDAVRVEVIGHQWWWEFRYPDQKVVTANELHVPSGKKIALYMTTADVLHSFWMPQLAAKRDVFPRRATTLWFTAPEPGDFTGQCAEFCGIQHGRMGFRVFVDTPGDFDAWVADQQVGSPMMNGGVVATDSSRPADSATAQAKTAHDSLMAAGNALFVSGGCIGCHAMVGTPMAGVMAGLVGPNLSHVGSRTTIVANLLENTPENVARWLHDPQAVKAGTLMKLPRKLTEDEIKTLVAYLEAHK